MYQNTEHRGISARRSIQLSNLPTELIVRTLSFLDVGDLARCQRTNGMFAGIIANSVLLQYQMAAEAAGVEDNPNSRLPLTERLFQLKTREYAWTHFEARHTTTIPVHHNTSTTYDLARGLYILGAGGLDKQTQSLQYIQLPSAPGEEPKWRDINIGREIFDIALAVDEHDLIAIITSPNAGNTHRQNMIVIEVLLLEFSTQLPHTACQRPILSLENKRLHAEDTRFAIGIAGENLAIFVTSLEEVFIFDWKRGNLKATIHAPKSFYFGAMVFVSEDILCLPQSTHPSLELYRIPSQGSNDTSSTHLKYSCALVLPRLLEHASLSIVECRSDPNPGGCGTGSHPFRCSPSEAIIVFNMIIYIPFMMTTSYSLIVHRRSLLAHLFPADCGTCIGRHGLSNSDPIPWALWGPQNTRLFSNDNIPDYLITTTSGQRYVQISTNGTESPITVLDFNPFNVRRAQGYSQDSFPEAIVRPVTERNIFSDRGVFADEVWTSLPYALCESTKLFDYDAVVMDEERILGLNMNEFSSDVASGEVLYFG